MNSGFTYIFKDETGFWEQGTRKRKLPFFADDTPIGFSGWVYVCEKNAVLYNADWTVKKTIWRKP